MKNKNRTTHEQNASLTFAKLSTRNSTKLTKGLYRKIMYLYFREKFCTVKQNKRSEQEFIEKEAGIQARAELEPCGRGRGKQSPSPVNGGLRRPR